MRPPRVLPILCVTVGIKLLAVNKSVTAGGPEGGDDQRAFLRRVLLRQFHVLVRDLRYHHRGGPVPQNLQDDLACKRQRRKALECDWLVVGPRGQLLRSHASKDVRAVSPAALCVCDC